VERLVRWRFSVSEGQDAVCCGIKQAYVMGYGVAAGDMTDGLYGAEYV